MNLQKKHERDKFISYVYSKNAYVNMYYNPRIPDPRPFLIPQFQDYKRHNPKMLGLECVVIITCDYVWKYN